jgi:GH15 family glucan-1,4-alpha-glucosidase
MDIIKINDRIIVFEFPDGHIVEVYFDTHDFNCSCSNRKNTRCIHSKEAVRIANQME